MKIVKGKITEIGIRTISRTGSLYSNVVLTAENGDRLRVSNLACDDVTDNRIHLDNVVTLHLLQARQPIRKFNLLVATEDSAGLTLARSPHAVALIGAAVLGLLTIVCLLNVWVLMLPFIGGLFLAIGLPTFRFFAAVRRFGPKGSDRKGPRLIEV
ncbi:hypothetical protein [Rhizobium sp. BK176]|uniref:hypothetical protein n=1 Tax=Rhizobium sp. BK176 TaxID=2587071 RepID=UPI00216A535F|nr:hypothetical protein [Rhizobium sp. BK176]MCS4089354.1 hypothetical protein [Rhizobium sp. BK176]